MAVKTSIRRKTIVFSKNLSALSYFFILRGLQATDTKESQIFYNRQRNCYNRGTGKEL